MENRKLIRIQTENNLNEVYTVDEPGAGNASHEYLVLLPTDEPDVAIPVEIASRTDRGKTLTAFRVYLTLICWRSSATGSKVSSQASSHAEKTPAR